MARSNLDKATNINQLIIQMVTMTLNLAETPTFLHHFKSRPFP